VKRNMILKGTALLACAVCAQAQEAKCSNETLKGAYGLSLSGIGPAPFVPPGRPGFVGQLEQLNGVVIQIFDGKGNFTQVDNVKGTVSGYVPDNPGKGTYTVNPDCSMIQTVNPAPGVTIVSRGVIVDGGKEFRQFTITPEAVNVVTVGRQIK
jgi:hypothetical protein